VRLSQPELLGFCFVLIVAGNDTTTNLIANGATLLAEHPDQRRLLAESPSRLPHAVEEMLRLESPAQALPRVAQREVTLHGVAIPAGSLVPRLGRGEPRPARVRGRRPRRDAPDPPPLGFARRQFRLALTSRLEARVAFEELLARLPAYALERASFAALDLGRAHDAVPVAFDPA
jgi:cytochrome P450